jgi:hypothetical protein
MAVDRIGDGLALRSKGDIVSHDGTANIAVSPGTNGQILTSITSTASGLGWSNYTAPVKDFEGISYTALTAAANTITLSGIPTTYGSIVAYIFMQGTTSGNNSLDGGALYVRINGNTTTQIYGPDIYRYGTGYYTAPNEDLAGAQGLGSATSAYIGSIGAANGNNSDTLVGRNFSCFEYEITDYADTTNFKTFRSVGGHDNGVPTTNYGGYYMAYYSFATAGTIRTTSAVTSITFFNASAGKNFITGTWIALFGVRK